MLRHMDCWFCKCGKTCHIHAVQKESQNESNDTVTSQIVPDNDERKEESKPHRIEASQSGRRGATFEQRRSKDCRRFSMGL